MPAQHSTNENHGKSFFPRPSPKNWAKKTPGLLSRMTRKPHTLMLSCVYKPFPPN